MTSLFTLELGVVLAATTSSMALAYGIASAPSRAPRRLGIRGLRRQRATEEGAFATIEPLVRWLGARLSGVVPERLCASLDRQLVLAGDYLGLTPEEYVASCVLALASGLLIGVPYRAMGGAAAGAVVLAVA